MKKAALIAYIVGAYTAGTVGSPDLLVSSESAYADELEAGKAVYIQCSGCHSFGYNRTGPKHCGIFGRAAGSVEGYEYSEAMRNSDIVWDDETLNTFIASPLTAVPGTSMGFIGITNQEKRQALIMYMKNQAHSNECNE